MKKLVALVLALVMSLSLVACGSSNSGASSAGGSAAGTSQKKITLKAGMSGGETSPTYIALSEFKKLLEEKSDGRIEVEIYENDQLSSGDQAKGCEMVMDGTIDVEMHSSLIWSAYVPEMQVIAFPFLFSGYDDVDAKVLDPNCAGYAQIQEWMGGTGVHTVGVLENGFRQISNSKKEILTPADVKGLKMRIPGIAMYVDLYKLLGASASPMNFSEVYTALQQGTIDGQENPLSAMLTGKFEEVQSYVTMWNYSYDIMMLDVSDKVWQTLSDEDKTLLEECGKEACATQVQASRDADAGFRKTVEDAGVKVTDLTDDQMKAFVDACAPLYEQYRETFGEDAFATFGYNF
ncbi:MAG: DctP family TRAP transporter solute-binding subunit [Oscillibacter sp.]|nr:DctP family TRAP transporter solute-binding subunit [Oscillibacter sp.]